MKTTKQHCKACGKARWGNITKQLPNQKVEFLATPCGHITVLVKTNNGLTLPS